MLEVSHLKAAFDSTLAPALLIGIQGRLFTILEANLVYLNYTGLSATILLGKDFSEMMDTQKILVANSKFSVIASIEKAITTGKKSSVTLNKYGQLFVNDSYCYGPIIVENIPIKDEIGAITTIIHVVNVPTSINYLENIHQNNIKLLEYYKFALDESSIIAITDAKGIIQSINDNFCEISGYSREELIGKTHKIINSKFHSADFFNSLWRTISSGKVWRGEIKNKTKSGKFYWVYTTITPFLDHHNKPFQYLAIRFDITEKKLGEEALLKSLNEKKNILESVGDVFIAVNKNWEVTYWNKQAEIILKIPASKIIGQNLWKIYNKDVDSIYYKKYVEAITTNNAVSFENYSTELAKWFDINVYPSEDSLSIYLKDITERKQYEIKQKEENIQNALFVSIVNSSNYGIISKTLDGVITSWNKGAENIFGYLEAEAIGKHIGIIIPPELFENEEPMIISNVKKETDVKHYETFRLNKNGEKIDVSLTVSPIRNKEGDIIGASKIIRNISDKRENERLLKEKNLELTEATEVLETMNKSLQKQAKELTASNAELEQFAYVASHDLQEPLRMVTSFLTQLNNKYENILDDKGKKYIEFAVDGARRMRQIILDLLEFSRVGRLENSLETVNIMALIDRIKVLFLNEIEEKKATIVYENLPTITSYPVPLYQVFQNLIGNALKYCKLERASVVTIVASEFDKYWQFAVADNGIGIEAEYFDKIFIIFQRLHTKEAYAGTGMGLAITKKIVENWGGKIWLISIENEGSIFYFTIPK